jgi:hypothetical protein
VSVGAVPAGIRARAAVAEYVESLLAVALHERASHVLLVPIGTALYRGAELRFVGPPAGEAFEEVLRYCREAAGLVGGAMEALCVVSPDGALGRGGAAGTPARLQEMASGLISGLRLVF